jgi:hypothetical protein
MSRKPFQKLEFRHAGLPCLMIQAAEHGHWCGYVGVPPGHPLHGHHYDVVNDHLNVHGGMTYSGRCQGHICHEPRPGEADDVWWLGFDFAHAGDLLYDDGRYQPRRRGDHYWTKAEVTKEVRRAAQDLATMVRSPS